MNELNAMVFNTLLWNSLLSLYLSLQVTQKIQIFDEFGMTGISSSSTSSADCPRQGWFVENSRIVVCLNGFNKPKNCTIVSSRYYVNATNELFMEIKTEARKCTPLRKNCEIAFILFATFESSKPNESKIDKIIAKVPYKKTLHLAQIFFRTTYTINFSRDQKYDYVKVGFIASSYCGNVGYSMYYYTCPESSTELVEFEKQAAPNMLSSPKIVVGKCTNFAVVRSSPLTMKCYFNGSFEVYGICECRPGFTNVNRKCQGWYYF